MSYLCVYKSPYEGESSFFVDCERKEYDWAFETKEDVMKTLAKDGLIPKSLIEDKELWGVLMAYKGKSGYGLTLQGLIEYWIPVFEDEEDWRKQAKMFIKLVRWENEDKNLFCDIPLLGHDDYEYKVYQFLTSIHKEVYMEFHEALYHRNISLYESFKNYSENFGFEKLEDAIKSFDREIEFYQKYLENNDYIKKEHLDIIELII